jgi:hypothetical protein
MLTGILRVNDRDGGKSSAHAGADVVISGGQQRTGDGGRNGGGGQNTGGRGSVGTAIQEAGKSRKGNSPALPDAGDRIWPGSDRAPDPRVSRGRRAEAETLAEAEVPDALHTCRHRTAGPVDSAHQGLSGAAVRRLLQRGLEVFQDIAYERLANISVSHIYNLRSTDAYRRHRAVYKPTQSTPVSIGERRCPDPKGSPGWLRVDTVHQGDPRDGKPGLYNINAVDRVEFSKSCQRSG